MARTPEQKSWDTFSKALVGRIRYERIENSVRSAMPDVIAQNRMGVSFWIENKAIAAWPARASTLPLRGRFERGQLGFLRAWMSWGGRGYVLLRVGEGNDSTYLLLNPLAPLDKMTREELARAIIANGKDNIIAFLEKLSNDS
jgi:hypothetical protein